MKWIYTIRAVLWITSASVYAQSGHVGIGVANPAAALHVADSSVVFTGLSALPVDPVRPPVIDAGHRMLWYAEKAAFRAGGVTGAQWNKNSIGQYSGAFGYNTRALGKYGFASGNNTSASGDGAFASGNDNLATGNYSSAFGLDNESQAYGSFVVGRYNIIEGSETEWIAGDPLFVVGNGYVDGEEGIGTIIRRNAFEIHKSGVAYFDARVTIDNNLNIDGFAFFDNQITVEGAANFEARVGIKSSGSLETALDVNGAIVLGDFNVNVDNGETLVVGDRGYIWLGVSANGSTIHLSNGLKPGQLLIIENASDNTIILPDADANLNLSGDRTLDKDDTIRLLWSVYGRWLELSFTNN